MGPGADDSIYFEPQLFLKLIVHFTSLMEAYQEEEDEKSENEE